MNQDFFKRCSICKTPIAFDSKYYACSVSTCRRGPLALFFCSVACWDAHVPEARHRDAWAEEETAPTREESVSVPREEKRRVVAAGVRSSVSESSLPAPEGVEGDEVLVVVSKLKAFVKSQGNMSTSDGVFPVLSNHLRALAVKALRSAAQNERKTVLARDFEAVLRGEVAKD